MKTKHLLITTILPLLLLFSTSLPAQTIDWDGVRQAYIDKYQPQQMPAWWFPIIFEDGTGARDTIYLGWDPEAQDFGFPQKDTVFGQRRIEYDTSTFNAGWGFYNDAKPLKVLIWQNFHSSSIGFRKGYLPLTMYWDRHAFYDTVLPFADQSPAPVAWGELSCSDVDPAYQNCPPHVIYLTDTSYFQHDPPSIYLYSDSLTYNGSSNTPADWISMQLRISPWHSYVGIKETGLQKKVKLYPNPVADMLNVHIDLTGCDFYLQIYDSYGRIVKEESICGGKENAITVSQFPNGLYFLKIISSYGSYMHTTPFVKLSNP